MPRPTSLILISLLLLSFSACDQGEPTPTTPPPAPTATTPQSDPGSMVATEPNGFALPDDPEKVAALEEAGFTLTRNAAGFVTEIVIATETSIADVLPNLEGVPNVTQARFSGPGLTDEGMEALEFIFSVRISSTSPTQQLVIRQSSRSVISSIWRFSTSDDPVSVMTV